MAKGQIRVVFDSNIWLSYIIGKTIKKLDNILSNGLIEVVSSELLIQELREKAASKKFRRYFQYSEFLEFLNHLSSISYMSEAMTEIDVCRDKDDNYLLALAIDSESKYLVTGDKDLLTLEKFQGVEIVTFNHFSELFIYPC